MQSRVPSNIKISQKHIDILVEALPFIKIKENPFRFNPYMVDFEGYGYMYVEDDKFLLSIPSTTESIYFKLEPSEFNVNTIKAKYKQALEKKSASLLSRYEKLQEVLKNV